MKHVGKVRFTIEVNVCCEAKDEMEALEKFRDWAKSPETLVALKKTKEAEYKEHRTIWGVKKDTKKEKAK